MYLNLDLLYNVSYFLTLRYYKRKSQFNQIICTYNKNFYIGSCYHYEGPNSQHNVNFYKKHLASYLDVVDLHRDILIYEFIEVEPFKMCKQLYYALITFKK